MSLEQYHFEQMASAYKLLQQTLIEKRFLEQKVLEQKIQNKRFFVLMLFRTKVNVSKSH